jgi:hypothetical protein
LTPPQQSCCKTINTTHALCSLLRIEARRSTGHQHVPLAWSAAPGLWGCAPAAGVLLADFNTGAYLA